MLHWLLTADALLVLAATLAIAGAACVFSASRAVGPFVLVALLSWAVATPFAAASELTLRGGIAAAAWLMVVVGFSSLPLGLLVARGATARMILLAAVGVLVLLVPVSFAAQALLQCYVGHYCPGL